MQKKGSRYEFGDVAIDVRARRISRRGQPLHLEPKGWEVLLLFVNNPDRLFEKQELLNTVWKDVSVSESAMTRVIADLRHALDDDVKEPKYIQTVHRLGYRFVADVKVTGFADDEPQVGVTGGLPAADSAPALAEPDAALPTATADVDAPVSTAAPDSEAAAATEWTWRTAALGSRRILVPAAMAALGLLVVLLSRSDSDAPRLSPVASEAPPGAVRLTTWSGLDSYPTLSRDGRSLAFSSDRTESFEIYVKQLIEGGRELQITSDGQQNTQPAWSPDGQYLAYHSRLRGGIWIVPALGGAARQVTTFGSRPAFAPSGQQIAFQSEAVVDFTENALGATSNSTIWVVPVQGGPPRRVTTPNAPAGGHASPAWSPDGSRITFTAASMGGTSLWSAAPYDDPSPTRIDCGEMACFDAAYATDALSLFYASASHGPSTAIWRVPVTAAGVPSARPVQVTSSAGLPRYRHLSVTPDGQRVSYSLMATTRNLWEVDVSGPVAQSGTTPHALTSDASGYSMPVFSPDGTQLAFVSGRAGPHPEVWITAADGSQPRPLASGRRALFPSWLPDGRHVVSSVEQNGRRVWLVSDVAGGEPIVMPLPAHAEHVRASPDGRLVAYDALIDGTRNIWVSTPDGAQATQVTRESTAEDPCWSPEGQWLAFEVKRQGDTYVGIVPSRGGRIDILVPDPGQNWMHSWAPGGDALAFVALRDGVWNVWTVSRESRRQQQITRYRRSNAYVRYPAWSPTGTGIVYEYGETVGQVWLLRLAGPGDRTSTSL